MKIEERNEGSAVVVSPAGRLDGAGAPVLEARVSAVVGRGGSRVVLDCSGIAYISSAGVRAIIIGAKACQAESVEFIVAELRPECRSVMVVSGLLSILDYRETVEAALARSRDRRRQTMLEGGLGMEIEEQQEGPTVVLSLNGQLNGASAPDLMSRVSAMVEYGNSRVALDCTGMSYVNSAGLRALLICAKACRQKAGKLVLAALRPECRSVIEMSGFLSVIDHRETRESALAALAQVRRS